MSNGESPEVSAKEPKVVEIVPILRGLPKPTLSYFYRDPIEEGEFVEVEVRGAKTVGIVAAVRDARVLKTDLKSAGFALKKLSKNLAGTGLSRGFVRAAEKTAEFYLSSPGRVLAALIPKAMLAEPELMAFRFPRQEGKKETKVIQVEREERFSTYRSVIREHFARKHSVMVVLPTGEEARKAAALLSPGIEEYAHLVLPANKKSLRDSLKALRKEAHPALIVTTPTGLVIDRADLATIIFDGEGSRGLRTRKRPIFSYKKFAEFYAAESGKQLILGDTVLSLETLEKAKQSVYGELSPIKWRLDNAAETLLVDMKQARPGRDDFRIFSYELEELIRQARSEERSVFLFGARKGLAPTTVCGDCGSVLPCQNCGAPIVLHEKRGERIYICRACGARRPAETRCDTCSSWKLVPLGIGIERIAEEVKKLFPKAPIFVFDRDHLSTAPQARKLAKEAGETPGAIIVGTELYLSYASSVDYAGVVTFDSLFALPDFGVHERVFALVMRLREFAKRGLIIQTRNIGREILTLAKTGNLLDFYRSEIGERKSFSYPPYSLFIKVSVSGSERELGEAAALLSRTFSEWRPDFIRERRGAETAVSMLLRVPREAWPEEGLRTRLALLDPAFSITVDPESII